MNKTINAKPFLKWAGGKTQLIKEIEKTLPKDISYNQFTYIEPFVGSGAVFFWIIKNFPKVRNAIINDINEDLISTYKTIRDSPNHLISLLSDIQNEFYELENDDEKKKIYYYTKRALFNQRKLTVEEHSALFIFLNRTCFNGLYRVNRNNEFNVPMGSYKKPKICDKDNLILVSDALKNVEILCGDFEKTLSYALNNTVFYLDPPYKPISETSNFNTYSKDNFDDLEQIRLKNFCFNIDKLGYKWVLSNSDVKSKNSMDNFFDELYSDYSIQRVEAKRSINSKPDKRGVLNELLITN